jgi:SAM-dependent methyltransferase
MTDNADANAQQLAFWNGPGSEMWVVRQKQMDAALAPVLVALMAHAAPAAGERVLDIGCGTGESVLALADAVGPAGHVTGLDISAPMLDLARTRAADRANVTLILGDAAAHSFAPAQADLLFSRFGVMFFGDPVAAFANMHAGLRQGGRVAFACWQKAAANPWVRVPQQAVAPLLPPMPPADPGLPGQFAFGDAARVAAILTASGFAAPEFTPFEFPMPVGRTLDDAVQRSGDFGATGRLLAEQPASVQQAARAALRAALAPHANAEGLVALPGATWLVSARKK